MLSVANATGQEPAAPVVVTQVATWCDGGDGQVAEDLCGHLDLLISVDPATNAVSPHRALLAGGDFDPGGELREALALLDEGRSLFQAGKEKKGLEILRRAVEDLLALEPYMDDRSVLVDALLTLAQAELAGGKESWRADEAAFRLLNFVPTMREGWRETVTAPELFALFERSEALLAEQAPGAARIITTPPNARIFIDGKYAGVSPLTVDAGPGEHLVRLTAPGYRPKAERVPVISGETTESQITLEEAPGFTTWLGIADGLAEEVGESTGGNAMNDLRSLLIADRLIAVRVGQENGAPIVWAWLYDLRSAQLLAKADLVDPPLGATDDRRAAAADLLARLADAAEVRARVPTDAELAGGSSIFNEWWFWTGVGVVVVGAGTAAVLLLSDDQEAPGPGGTNNGKQPPPPGTGDVILRF